MASEEAAGSPRKIAGAAPEPAGPKWHRRLWLPLVILAVAGGAVIAMAVAGEVAARRRARSVEVLRELGRVEFGPPRPLSWPLKYILSPDGAERPVITVVLRGEAVTDAALEHVGRMDELGFLLLCDTRVTDEGLAHLRELSKLDYLNLAGTRVTDAGLAHLSDLTKLGRLSLRGTRVAGEGLDHLRGLSKLRLLDLSDTRVTDEGLAHLRGLSNVGSLYLSGTRVTDEGLAHLRGLSKLGLLYLGDTSVTDGGAAALKKRLPGLLIRVRP